MINIAPSRIAAACHASLLGCVIGLVMLYGKQWLVFAILIGGAGAVLVVWCARPLRGSLRWFAHDEARGSEQDGQWQWRAHKTLAWREVAVRVTYLGPWLIGLEIDKYHYWLWPDSASSESLRRLRRHLLIQAERV